MCLMWKRDLVMFKLFSIMPSSNVITLIFSLHRHIRPLKTYNPLPYNVLKLCCWRMDMFTHTARYSSCVCKSAKLTLGIKAVNSTCHVQLSLFYLYLFNFSEFWPKKVREPYFLVPTCQTGIDLQNIFSTSQESSRIIFSIIHSTPLVAIHCI